MHANSPRLFIEINKSDYIFSVCDNFKEQNSKLIIKYKAPIKGISSSQITDPNLVSAVLKENIYIIEKKIGHTFKEVILIIDNFDNFLINCSGFKKLNSSQLQKDNIIHILNSLKSSIDQNENDKKLIHIFNTKFLLDKKDLKNLPIGLFGDFYAHELSFFLIKLNDFKNIINIFKRCNIKIHKILSKSFLEGTVIINDNLDLETFFKIKINKNNSQIFFFEKSSLKQLQNFHFGSDLIIKDISKITSIEIEDVKNILNNLKLSNENSEKQFLEREFFKNKNFRKIKKKLIIDIAKARINEIAQIILFKNINFKNILKNKIKIFLDINCIDDLFSLKDIFEHEFSNGQSLELEFFKNSSYETFITNANRIVQFGWVKEAVPVIQEKKSIISRLFNLLR